MQQRRLIPLEDGARLGIYLGAPRENSSEEVRQILQTAMNDGYDGLRSFIEHNVSAGKITVS
jgi:hypothetical protein